MTKIVSLNAVRNVDQETYDVCVSHLGATGLPLAVGLAGAGLRVLAIDDDPVRIAAVNGGRLHHVDPKVADALRSAVEDGRLSASHAPRCAKVFIVTDPAEPSSGDGAAAEFGALEHALEKIAPVISGDELILLESSGPLGMTARAEAFLRAYQSSQTPAPAWDLDFGFAGERARPGRSLDDLASIRSVGGITARATDRAAAFYRRHLGAEVEMTDHRTAEMVKLVENAFRDLNIAFANELSMVCDDMGLNVWDVIGIANHHPRVQILQPGAGVGGKSVALDPKFLIAADPVRTRLIQAARQVNEAKPDWIVEQVAAAVGQRGVIACMGLTAKPGTDLFDASPALDIARAISARFPGRVVCTDPYQDMLATDLGLSLTDTDTAYEQADFVVFLVAHERYRKFRVQAEKVFIDVCGATDMTSYMIAPAARSSLS